MYIYMYTLIDWDYMAVICGPHTLPRYTSQNGSILLNVASDAEGNKTCHCTVWRCAPTCQPPTVRNTEPVGQTPALVFRQPS